jgi:broad specificity phosphatase PhoE
MEHQNTSTPAPAEAATAEEAGAKGRPPRRLFLVRHGQTTFNVEGRLPGQIAGVGLTDVGRRQAHQAAVALSATPLTAVFSSPLERARDTAEIIARGWGVQVRTDWRLADTDIGRWAGQKIDDLAKSDPDWKAFLRHPSEAPAGIESLAAVMQRAVTVVEELRRDESVGDNVALVAHADVVKLIVAYYLGVKVDRAPAIHVDNASISTLVFHADEPPVVLAVNWTPTPGWMFPPRAEKTPQAEQGASGAVPAEPAHPEADAASAAESTAAQVK